MKSVDALNSMRPNWLRKIANKFARGEDLRESFRVSLERFYDLLQQAVESGDPQWLLPILDEWVEARTSSDLDNLETSLTEMLNQILLISLEVTNEKFQPEDALLVDSDIIPIFLFALSYSAHRETELQIQHISRELEQANINLEQLDRSKSDFIAIAAHELKTPLTLIEGYCSMLRDQLPSQNGGLQFDILLKGIDNGTYRLREIVDDMIDVSLIDNDLLSLNFQPVWINRIFAVLQHEFSEIIKQRALNVEIKDFPGCDEMTFGDDERLFQALRNVFSNSVKYTPDGGSIVVDGRQLPGFIEIIVSDTGIGIDQNDHTRIFEKFGRLGSVSLHSSGKTKFKGGGPGLGLPITKGIIEAHGGAIWVESEGYDELNCPGSTFHVLLPLRKSPPDDRTAKLFSPISEPELGENS
jgi:signal transduction histidine kinase